MTFLTNNMNLFEPLIYLILLLLIFVKTKKQSSVLFWFALFVCVLFLSVSIKNIFYDEYASWDFQTYYYASVAFGQGVNPYLDWEVYPKLGVSILQYRYFPVTLYLFKIFTLWDYPQILQIFILLKAFLYFLTVLIWLKYVFKDCRLKTFIILIAAFGFNKAAILDFNSGNISIFEIFVFTIAVIFLLRNNVTGFCLIILFLALFKVQLLAFIFLPLIKFEKKRVYIILASLFMFTLLFLSYYYLEHTITQAYVDQIYNTLGEKGKYSPNYGALQLINTFVIPLLKPIIDFKYLNYIIYFSWIVLISILTFFVFKKAKNIVSNLIQITFIIFVYALIIPRFQDYTFTLLFVPAVYVIYYCSFNKFIQSVLCLLICTGFLGFYQPIIVVIVLFAMYVIFFYRISAGKINFDRTRESEIIL